MSLMNNRFFYFVEEVSDLSVNGNSFNFVDNYVSLGIVDDFNAMLSFNFFFAKPTGEYAKLKEILISYPMSKKIHRM